MRKELIETENIMQLMQRVKGILERSGNMNDMFVKEILNAVEAVNIEIYGCKEYPGINLYSHADNPVLFSKQFDLWQNLLAEELQYRKAIVNKILHGKDETKSGRL